MTDMTWRSEFPEAEADYITGRGSYAPGRELRWVGEGPSVEYDGPLDVAEIERCYWSYYGVPFADDGTELVLYALVRLADGNFAAVDAWNDYTGWGCQDGLTWWVGATRDAVVAHGLDDEGRRYLGLDGDKGEA